MIITKIKNLTREILDEYCKITMYIKYIQYVFKKMFTHILKCFVLGLKVYVCINKLERICLLNFKLNVHEK